MDEKMKATLIQNMTDNLPVLRKKLHLSQEDLAKLVGISRVTIATIESGKHPMSWGIFLNLILIFTKNKETDKLLAPMEIYTDELNDLIKLRNEE